ncbi:hypothetical protein MTP03_21660 [Tsukamurella sp. PLM1]|nr:hypothetical protein MTP03_21660 [Tsukamurella sp. PLM1]
MTAPLETVAPSTRLSAARRAADLTALVADSSVDLLVIGGGVTGTGVALDAASRGLRVALVEKHDLAFGTSRWSSKLVHGGLRYLASGAVGIAYESAVERDALIRTIAPHLTRPWPRWCPSSATCPDGTPPSPGPASSRATCCGARRARRRPHWRGRAASPPPT